jgi:glutamate synthase (NADPH/NADH) small chain
MRQKMRKQDPKIRAKNFNEVALGYSAEEAIAEAKRCAQCKSPSCISGCPVEIDIPAFIALIANGKFEAAAKKLKEKNRLPAVCGRVCPQESQCEKVCVFARLPSPTAQSVGGQAKKNESVAIGRLERFAADFEITSTDFKGSSENIIRNTKAKVAVVGSGPAGLTCAGDLAKMGYQVTVFESLHETGGVLSYGIPEFRLPKKIVKFEVDGIRAMGVDIQINSLIGRTLTIDDLRDQGFKAIFIGAGAGLPQFLGIPGENLGGVYSANEFLTRVNLMKAYLFPEYLTPVKIGKKVVVVGGGNVAMDAARCAARLGAEKVTVVYRRSEKEMPARKEEIENAKDEGIEFMVLTNPKTIKGNNGWISQMQLVKMELGEPDSSGRRRPLEVKGSEFFIDVDSVVVAVGNNPNPLLPREIKGLKIEKWGGIIADKVTGQTSVPYIFAGGDIVSGAATVIEAMGTGKRAARAIDEYLSNSPILQ